jgi:hypothetical protein
MASPPEFPRIVAQGPEKSSWNVAALMEARAGWYNPPPFQENQLIDPSR